MPTFLKDLRRRSRSSIPKDNTGDANQLDMAFRDPPPPPPQDSFTNGAPPVPPRPANLTSQNSRYSVNGASSPSVGSSQSQNSNRPSASPTSPYAPRVLSVSENSWVHQKILLIYGQIADPASQPMDGTLWVWHHQDNFPAVSFPVFDSHFKALVHLQPGPNRLRFDFVSPKVPTPNGQGGHSAWFNLNYMPLIAAPPLDLVILLGKDSPGTYDVMPERGQREGNGLDMAIKKFRMAAYLWQAFTGEQMNRNGFGRRCFRFEEEWQPGTLSCRDAASGTMRNEAKIHIIRTQKTVAELRDPEVAQQNRKASRAGDLHSIAGDAVRDYFKMQPAQRRYVSVLILDTHWDPKMQLIRGHAALGAGGGGEGLQWGVFGSHALFSYPSCLEEVAPAFMDCTRTDTSFVANDLNESGTNWEAANIGIGAHLHETGHMLGCPHQENGVMLRDYTRLNRAFVCREAYSTRTNSSGQRLCLQADECGWHRLDCLRFRFHPCFQLPTDPPIQRDADVHVWTVENNAVLVTSNAGITFIELFQDGDDTCKAHLEYCEGSGPTVLPKQLLLNETDLRQQLRDPKSKRKLKLEIFTVGGASHKVEDFGELSNKSSRVKLPDGRTGFRSSKLGGSSMDGSKPDEVLFASNGGQRKLLTAVRVFSGFALDGMEFFYEDRTSQLFGKRGGSSNDFVLDTRRGETIIGLNLRSGAWIDAVQILTSLGRKSDMYGNAEGGSGHTLIPPRSYTIAGISGSCANWIDGIAVIIAR